MIRLLKPVLFIVLLFLSTSFSPPEFSSQREMLLQIIMQNLKSTHFEDVKIDDNFSKKVFDLYLKRLDFGKRFLLKSDYIELEKYTQKIDDQINSGNFEFYDKSTAIYLQRMEQVKAFYPDLLSKPFDFSLDESLETDEEKVDYCLDINALKDYWRKSLKYQTLTRIIDVMKEQNKAIERKDSAFVPKSFEEIEASARQKVLKSQDDLFKRIDKLREDDRLSVYLNAVVGVFDPHTEYFPPKDKQDFDIRMSGRLEGIGATLQASGDYIKVTRIVPGSASWKQGELKAGDLIMKVAQGDQEAVDIVGMRLDDAVLLIRGKKGTEVRLTVKKTDGTMKIIPIIRDVVILDETLAKSAIVTDDKTGTKVGYIKLPEFYTDFTKTGGSGCASDIKAEINKLQKENIDGIVFDLRDNGGGSLSDVVDIAGYFIPKGPIVQVKARYGQPQMLEDYDPTVLYNGPLVILVNTLSASASEIMGAALQDYKRAVIIGSTSTYGKGSVQRFFDMDSYVTSNTHEPQFGSLKVTIQNFYRINGATTQLKGVIPDIILPDIYSYSGIGEWELDYPLPWNTIPQAKYNYWTPNIQIESIKKKSVARTSNNSYFTLVAEEAMELKKQRDKTNITLKLDDYKKEMDEFELLLKKYDNIEKVNNNMKIISLSEDLKKMASDTASSARAKVWFEEISKDSYIYEAINVVNDLKK